MSDTKSADYEKPRANGRGDGDRHPHSDEPKDSRPDDGAGGRTHGGDEDRRPGGDQGRHPRPDDGGGRSSQRGEGDRDRDGDKHGHPHTGGDDGGHSRAGDAGGHPDRDKGRRPRPDDGGNDRSRGGDGGRDRDRPQLPRPIESGKSARGPVVASLDYSPNGEHFYFFKDELYGTFAWYPGTVHEHTVREPKKIVDGWRSLREIGFNKVDCAILDPDTAGQAYFFLGKYCALISVEGQAEGKDFVVEGPHPIAHFFPSLATVQFDTVDACYPIPETPEIYFFRGNMYTRISFPDHLGSYIPSAKVIDSMWPSLKQCGFSFIDTVLPVPDNSLGNAYYFSGESWARIYVSPNGSTDTVTHGPLSVHGLDDADHWQALTEVHFY